MAASDTNLTNRSLVKLRTITTKIGSGATPTGGKESYRENGITLIRSLNVYDFQFDYDGLAFIDERQAKQLSNVEVHSEDILLNITGASVARCCMVPQHLLPARVNQHVSIVRADPTLADPHYVLYCLNSPRYKQHLLTIAQGGATREALTKDKIGDFEIPLPTFDVQRKIASILSAYDDLIENNTRRIKILEEMAQVIYREWFVNFRFPGHENVKMVKSELGTIPDGWEVKSYTDIIDVLSGGTPRTSMSEYWDGDIPWFTPRDLGDSWYVLGTVRQITKLGLSKCNSDLYPQDTVFITARGTVGRCVLAGVPMAMSQTSYALKGHAGIPQSYVFLLTLSLVERFKKQATGAVFDTIVVDTFRKQRVVEPTVPVLASFAESVNPILNLLKSLQLKNINLRRTRDLLLPKLISGEVDVEKLDITTGGLDNE